MTKTLFNLFLITLAGTVVLAEKFTVAGINFESPDSWESSEPSNNMRKAQFNASSPSGKNAIIYFSHFGSSYSSGMTKANVDRWMKQFEEPLGKKVDTETIGKTKVTYAQAHGTFLSGRFGAPKVPNQGYAMLGVIIESQKGPVYVKMTGPKAAVEANVEATKKMIKASLSE